MKKAQKRLGANHVAMVLGVGQAVDDRVVQRSFCATDPFSDQKHLLTNTIVSLLIRTGLSRTRYGTR